MLRLVTSEVSRLMVLTLWKYASTRGSCTLRKPFGCLAMTISVFEHGPWPVVGFPERELPDVRRVVHRSVRLVDAVGTAIARSSVEKVVEFHFTRLLAETPRRSWDAAGCGIVTRYARNQIG